MFRDRFTLAASALCLFAFGAAFVAFRAASAQALEQAPKPPAAHVCQHAEVVMIAHRAQGSHATLRAGDGSTWSQREGQSTRGHRLEAIELDRLVLSHEGGECELRVTTPLEPRELALR